jgi:hypothetical protein
VSLETFWSNVNLEGAHNGAGARMELLKEQGERRR